MSNAFDNQQSINLDYFKNAQIYHNQNSLSELKRKGQDDNPEAIREAAKQFESIFTGMMLKAMRDANSAIIDEPLFNSAQLGMYEDMYDEQLSLHLSKSKNGLGLTDILVQQLSGLDTVSSYNRFKTNADLDDKTDSNLIDGDNIVNTAISGNSYHSPNIEFGFKGLDSENLVTNKIENKKLKDDKQLSNKPEVQNSLAESTIAPKKTQEVGEVAERGLDFSSPASFVQSLWTYAENAAKSLNLDPKILIAQAALETGWGKYVMRTEQGESSKNLFGIKASENWQGEKTTISSLEVDSGVMQQKTSDFRAYDSYEHSFQDYAEFINSKSRYQDALSASSNPRNYIRNLQQAGYATDPEYAQKIERIYDSSTLNRAIKDTVKSFVHSLVLGE